MWLWRCVVKAASGPAGLVFSRVIVIVVAWGMPSEPQNGNFRQQRHSLTSPALQPNVAKAVSGGIVNIRVFGPAVQNGRLICQKGLKKKAPPAATLSDEPSLQPNVAKEGGFLAQAASGLAGLVFSHVVVWRAGECHLSR